MPAHHQPGGGRCLALACVVFAVIATACGGDDAAVEPPVTSAIESSTIDADTRGEATTTTGLATAAVERLVDEFYATLENTDPPAAALLFIEDGVFVDKFGAGWVGTSGITAYVEQVGPGITRCERTGPVEHVGDSAYTFPVEFTYQGLDHARAVELTVDEGLIAQHRWLEDE